MKKKYFLNSYFFVVLLLLPLLLVAQTSNDNCEINLVFDYAVEDLDLTFKNLSTGYDKVLWEFGDGHTSTKESPTHRYEKTNAYEFCLTLSNSTNEECEEKFCGQVYVFDPCE